MLELIAQEIIQKFWKICSDCTPPHKVIFDVLTKHGFEGSVNGQEEPSIMSKRWIEEMIDEGYDDKMKIVVTKARRKVGVITLEFDEMGEVLIVKDVQE